MRDETALSEKRPKKALFHFFRAPNYPGGASASATKKKPTGGDAKTETLTSFEGMPLKVSNKTVLIESLL
jgi:hypothetical protein